MDKYAVLTEKPPIDGIKLAEINKCPLCNSPLLDSNVKICPIHGSKPFEKKDE